MENKNPKNTPPKTNNQNKDTNIKSDRQDLKNVSSAMLKDAKLSVIKNNLTEKEKIASGNYCWKKTRDKYGKESMSLVKRISKITPNKNKSKE